MQEEETALEYLARTEKEKYQKMWEVIKEWEREEDRRMLKSIKAVEAEREGKLRKRRQRYADNKGSNTN